jgi:phytoene dehydrogenase-like protein
MTDKSVIIVGAGIAGLSAGIYGQMNGYKTQIYEMGIKPGGLCTAWERKGYVIDGCLHWLVGSSPQSSYHHLWQEVGALKDQQIINLDQFMRIETSSGKTITFYTDIDKLEEHLKEFAPEDSEVIAEFCKSVRRFAHLDLPADKAPELYSTIDKAKMAFEMASYMGDFQKWGKQTIQEFASRFKNQDLQQAWLMVWTAGFSVLFLIYTLAWMTAKNAGYLIGGSLQLALAMEKRYYDLGGKINYKSGVEKILVENGRACGVKLANGNEYKADYVISAADGHSTIYEMLEGKFTDSTIDSYYKMPIFQPLVYMGLGINRPFADLPQLISGLVFPLEKPITIGDQNTQNLGVRIINYDPTMAASGKTTLLVCFESRFQYWAELRQNPAAYRAEKERIAVAVVSALNKRFPGLAKEVEMWDVATPVTFYRYTGNWQGSFEGFLITPQNMRLQIKKTLPGLHNFYMAGQWVQPGGGLPSALITGNHVIQLLCRKDKKTFAVSLPPETPVEKG